MKKIIMLFGLLFVGVVGWRIGDGLSADALGMAVGVLLGVLAMIPVTLVALAGRRDEYVSYKRESHSTIVVRHIHHTPRQPPVDVVPPTVALAAHKWGGEARWDDEGQYWLIVNPATGRIVARQRKQIAAEPLLLQA